MAGFSRGFVTVSTDHSKCEACSVNRLSVRVEGAGLIATYICVRCLVDALLDLLPDLARELVRWRREHRG